MAKGASKIGGGKIQAKTYALFHGSPSVDIEEFDLERAGTNTETHEKFLFFTDSEDTADEFSYERLPGSLLFDKRGKKGKVYEVDVTMSHPLDFTNLSSQDIKNILKMDSDNELTESMIDRFSKGNNQLFKSYIDINEISRFGYDGFIAKMNSKGDKEYAVLSNKQVKIKRPEK